MQGYESMSYDRPKICGNCSFTENFHTRKLGGKTCTLPGVAYVLLEYHENG